MNCIVNHDPCIEKEHCMVIKRKARILCINLALQSLSRMNSEAQRAVYLLCRPNYYLQDVCHTELNFQKSRGFWS